MHTRFTFELAGVGSLLCLGACLLTGVDDDDGASSEPGTQSATDGDEGTGTSPGTTDADASGSESASTDDTAEESGSADSTDGGTDPTGNEPGEPIVLVDCGADENDDAPQCDNYPEPGTIGAGPLIYGDSQIYAGFLDGSMLYVAVDLGANSDDIGGVMRIDL